MPQPTPYDRQYNFQDHQAVNPVEPPPGDQLDMELNAAKITLDQILANIAKIQRDDGALKNGIVTKESLAAGLSIGFTFKGTWAVTTNYSEGDGAFYGTSFYRAKTSHLSTNGNRPDVDSTTWLLLANFTVASAAAQAFSEAAAASAAAAATSASGAATAAQDVFFTYEFSAVGGGTGNDTAYLANLLTLYGSVSPRQGTYALTLPLTIAANKTLDLRPGAKLTYAGAGTLALASGGSFSERAYGATADVYVRARAFGAARGSGGQDPLGVMQFAIPAYMDVITADAADIGAGFACGDLVVYRFGGSTTKGGRVGGYAILDHTAPTNTANPNRNYVGLSGIAISRGGDGGTDLTTGAKGAYFGLHGYTQNFGGTNLLEVAGVEFNTYMATGTSAQIVAGVTSIGMNRVHGTLVDAAYLVGFGNEFSDVDPNPVVGWKYGLQFSDSNGAEPMSASGILIGSNWKTNPTSGRSIFAGLDLRGFSPSQAGVLGKQSGGGGSFLQFLNAAATADLFAVGQSGTVAAVGYQSRTGTGGAFGGNYHNWNWTGAVVEHYVDASKVGNVAMIVSAPANSGSAGAVGQVAYDASYRYECIGTNTWVRFTKSVYGSTF